MTGLLTGQEIKEKGLIQQGGDESGYRLSSYDVHIEEIICPDGSCVDSYKLPTQGIVKVISRERLRLPPDISGYALVKTSLCDEGLLALNIGVIDPGYEGKLSSALINFGKRERLLHSGETFLRLSFHAHSTTAAATKPPLSDKDYTREKQKQVVAHFSEYFLSIDELVKKTTDDAFGRWRKSLFFWVPLATIVLAGLTFLLNFGALWSIQRLFQPTDNARAEVLRWELERRADLLKEDVRSMATTITSEKDKEILERLDKLDSLLKQALPAREPPESRPAEQ